MLDKLLNKIKNFLNSEDKKRLLSNFLSLSILQGANYILPLITFPYLVRVLGPEKFGLIAFAQAFIQYFNILTDYGFNLSATRKISIHRENKEKISEIFSSVMIIKFALLILSFIIMTIIVFSFEKFRKDWLIYYLTFGIVVGQALSPVWFFQGIEEMKYITFLNILAKLIFTIAIFIFIQESSDYIYVPLLNSLGLLMSGILALWIVFRNFRIKIIIPSLKILRKKLGEGWHIFISQLSTTLFNNTNIFVLGLLHNNIYVTYYSIAEKLIRVVITFQVPVITVVYPRFSSLIIKDLDRAIYFARKILILGVGSYLFLSIVLFYFSEDLIIFVFGEQAQKSILIFEVLLILPTLIFINNIYGTQFLINIDKGDKFSIVLITAGFINFILCIPLTYFYGAIGTAISWIVTEIFVTYGMYFYATRYIKKLKIKYILLIKSKKDEY